MKRRWLVPPAGIAAVALALRWWGTTRQGLLFWDEGLFLLGARFVQTRLAELIGLGTGSIQGFPVLLEKPLHVILLAILGARGLTAATGAHLSALAGTLAVLVAYRATRMTGGRWAGWIAALFLTFSSYHLLYSRTGLHEIDSGLLGAAAAALVLADAGRRPRPVRRLAAGFLFGLALLTSYRLILLAPLVLGLDLGWSLLHRRVRPRERLLAEASAVAGFLAALLGMELVYRILFAGELSAYTNPSYLRLLRLKFTSESGLDWSTPLFYIRMMARVEGWPTTLVVLGAVAWNCRLRCIRRLLPAALVIVPLMALSFSQQRLARGASMVLPWVAVNVGLLVGDLLQDPRYRRRWAGLCLLGVLAVGAIRHVPAVLEIRSGYTEAVAWIRDRGEEGHFSTMMPVSAFLVGEQRGEHAPPLFAHLAYASRAEQVALRGGGPPGGGREPLAGRVGTPGAIYPPPTLAELAQKSRELGFRYLITDWQKHVWFHPSIQALEEGCPRAADIPNPMVGFPTVLHENYLPGDAQRLRQWDPSLDRIWIYDLQECLPRLLPGMDG